jgi:hypothetical protein
MDWLIVREVFDHLLRFVGAVVINNHKLDSQARTVRTQKPFQCAAQLATVVECRQKNRNVGFNHDRIERANYPCQCSD